ncbi:MAG: peptidase, partial [Nitrosopumilus sp.]
MRNQHQDSKILSTLSRILASTLLLFFGFSLLLLIPQFSSAEVFIPTDEYVGYFNANGIYTVVGNVKNDLDYDIVPTISISVRDGSETFSKTIQHVPLNSGAEIPFKIKFPEVLESTPTLMPAVLSFEKTKTDVIPIDVIYDKTLIIHEDGHLTGRIVNTGTETISDIKIFAVVHGFDDETLDVSQNFSPIIEMKPGEIREFSMYPDSTVASQVWYYSCFAVGQDSIVVLNVPRNDDMFKIRYDSGILLSYPEFDSKGTSLSFSLIEGWPLQDSINLEFSRYSENESFEVFLNEEYVNSIQSIDDMGNWHVAFLIEPQSAGTLMITGFDPEGEPIETIFIPDWIRNEAYFWSTDQSNDVEFLEGIEFLFEQEFVFVSLRDTIVQSQWKIPQWVKYSAGWWYEEKISDSDFL